MIRQGLGRVQVGGRQGLVCVQLGFSEKRWRTPAACASKREIQPYPPKEPQYVAKRALSHRHTCQKSPSMWPKEPQYAAKRGLVCEQKRPNKPSKRGLSHRHTSKGTVIKGIMEQSLRGLSHRHVYVQVTSSHRHTCPACRLEGRRGVRVREQ